MASLLKFAACLILIGGWITAAAAQSPGTKGKSDLQIRGDCWQELGYPRTGPGSRAGGAQQALAQVSACVDRKKAGR